MQGSVNGCSTELPKSTSPSLGPSWASSWWGNETLKNDYFPCFYIVSTGGSPLSEEKHGREAFSHHSPTTGSQSKRGLFHIPLGPRHDKTDLRLSEHKRIAKLLPYCLQHKPKFLGMKTKVLHHLTQICPFQPSPTITYLPHASRMSDDCLNTCSTLLYLTSAHLSPLRPTILPAHFLTLEHALSLGPQLECHLFHEKLPNLPR